MASQLESTLTRAWLRRGPLACALYPLSLLFRALTALRRRLYRAGILRSNLLSVPVVVVNADQFAMHQMVVNVMEAARIAGFDRLTFAAQSGSAR